MKADKSTEEQAQNFTDHWFHTSIPYKEHALIDFRKGSTPIRLETLRDNRLYINFKNNYAQATICRKGHDVESIDLRP